MTCISLARADRLDSRSNQTELRKSPRATQSLVAAVGRISSTSSSSAASWPTAFLMLRCGECGHDRLLAFSCKRRARVNAARPLAGGSLSSRATWSLRSVLAMAAFAALAQCCIVRPCASQLRALWQRTRATPNPSLHLTGYSGLRPLPPAGELKR
jgi:hypothetical protein